MKKAQIKLGFKQEVREPEVVFEIIQAQLGTKNQTETLDLDNQPKTVENVELPFPFLCKTEYEPVDESVLKAAFCNLRMKTNRGSLGFLSLKSLLLVFKGLIAEQFLENSINQGASRSGFFGGVDCGHFELDFEFIAVEDKKEMIVEAPISSFEDRVLLVRKNKWFWLKKETIKQAGKIPDCVFFIQIMINNFENQFKNLKSKNLQTNLSVIKDSFSNKDDNYFVEFVGWLEGVDVEELNDSEICQPFGLTLRKPSFWCYTSNPILKAMHEFRRKYSSF